MNSVSQLREKMFVRISSLHNTSDQTMTLLPPGNVGNSLISFKMKLSVTIKTLNLIVVILTSMENDAILATPAQMAVMDSLPIVPTLDMVPRLIPAVKLALKVPF